MSDKTDDVIALVVTLAGTACAGYITIETGDIPEFFIMAFGMIIAYFFRKKIE